MDIFDVKKFISNKLGDAYDRYRMCMRLEKYETASEWHKVELKWHKVLLDIYEINDMVSKIKQNDNERILNSHERDR